MNRRSPKEKSGPRRIKMPSDKEMVFVLWWQYRDNSDADVCRVYESGEDAQEDAKLLNDKSTVKYNVTSAEFMRERPKGRIE
jgi:hypothetical protein